MTDLSIILPVIGSIVVILLGTIGFFLRGISKKIDNSQSLAGCQLSIKNCYALQAERLKFEDERRARQKDKIDDLIESFDSLCVCLKTFTKGECP